MKVVNLQDKRLTPKALLEASLKDVDGLEGIIILGWAKGDEGELYMGSSYSYAEANWLLDQSKKLLLGDGDE